MSFVRSLSMAVAALAVLCAPAAAQKYPERVVRIVNPYPPGGSVDITARLLANKLSEQMGQQFIVENRAGAGGNIGADHVAKSTPDGHTLLFSAPAPFVINQTLYTAGLPYNPGADFAPIAVFARTPIVLMVHPTVAAKDVKELVALAKKAPGKIGFASAGIGTTQHLTGELFKSLTKVDIIHVPYKGAGPAMNDLVGGHVQMFFDLLPGSLPQIEGGKVRALANAGATRAEALKTLPTVAEQGLPGFDSSSWVALAAPAKTPPAIVARLREEVAKAMKSPDVVAQIRKMGSEMGTSVEAEVKAFFAAEEKKWGEVIKASGAKAN
jgi:tripartite-type tricarboxylate transporter receptor subunit TctC